MIPFERTKRTCPFNRKTTSYHDFITTMLDSIAYSFSVLPLFNKTAHITPSMCTEKLESWLIALDNPFQSFWVHYKWCLAQSKRSFMFFDVDKAFYQPCCLLNLVLRAWGGLSAPKYWYRISNICSYFLYTFLCLLVKSWTDLHINRSVCGAFFILRPKFCMLLSCCPVLLNYVTKFWTDERFYP